MRFFKHLINLIYSYCLDGNIHPEARDVTMRGVTYTQDVTPIEGVAVGEAIRLEKVKMEINGTKFKVNWFFLCPWLGKTSTIYSCQTKF